MTDDSVAIHGISCRSLRHASAMVSTTNATVTAAATAGERTWKRTVDSHNSGERISVDVMPYVMLAKRLAAWMRTAQTIQKDAYRIATKSTGNFGIELDSAIARNRYAPAIPRTALPRIGTAPDGVSRGGNPRHVAGGRGRCSRVSDERASNAGELPAGQGSFDSASASLREALAPLRMTDCVSRAATRCSMERSCALSCSSANAMLSTACGMWNSASARKGLVRSVSRSCTGGGDGSRVRPGRQEFYQDPENGERKKHQHDRGQ